MNNFKTQPSAIKKSAITTITAIKSAITKNTIIKNNWRYVFLFIATLILGATLAACQPGQSADNPPKFDRRAVISIADDDSKREDQFTVELAITPEQQQYGLMFRDQLADDRGMLFVFDPPREVGFWMKNTLIPLDMIFISPDNRVIKVHDSATPHDTTLIQSGGRVKYVLEIPGGQATKRGISSGDRLMIKEQLAISNE